MQLTKPKVVWTVAGFDPSSGAGVTADLMTFAAHGLFGCSAITALTVQSTVGVAAIEVVRPTLVQGTLQQLFRDLPPAGIKIGMLGDPEIAQVVIDFLRSCPEIPVVFDPVLQSSSGCELFPASGLQSLRDHLLPQVDYITPNWPELTALTDMPVKNLAEAERAARSLIGQCPRLNVVATGGDQATPTDLLLTPAGERVEFSGEHIETTSTHGTGCAFSSALLAQLVYGTEGFEAVGAAKSFVQGALRHAPGLGHGKGPLGLLWNHTQEVKGVPPVVRPG